MRPPTPMPKGSVQRLAPLLNETDDLNLKAYQRIPPLDNGTFVVHMEQVIDGYKQPCDPLYSLVGMDEPPKQLIAEKRRPIPAKPG